MRLLLTRPEPEAARSALALIGRGHQALVAPLMTIEALAADFGPGPFVGVLATSANALRAIAEHPQGAALRSLPLLTVGDHTARAGRMLGFHDIRSAAGDAQQLVALAAATFVDRDRPLLYLAGQDRAADLAGLLGSLGCAVRTVVTYRARPAQAFPAPVITALREERIDGVLHYSRRTAETYLACAEVANIRRAAAKPVQYCLSHAIATVVSRGGASEVAVAAHPDEAALFRLIRDDA